MYTTNVGSRTVPVHTNPHIFETAFFFTYKSAFLSHETSESAQEIQPQRLSGVRGSRDRLYHILNNYWRMRSD